MPRDRMLQRIERAATDGRLVRVTRRRGWDRLEGSIVAHSAKWLLLAVEFDAGFNGHTLLRVADVRRLDAVSGAAFVERALAAEGHWPLPRLDGLDLANTRAAIRSLTATAPLVSIHYEQDHPDECLIGVPRDFRRRRFRLQTVTPTAEWDREDSVFRYRSVSRVDVGAAYERRLAAIAGAPPTQP